MSDTPETVDAAFSAQIAYVNETSELDEALVKALDDAQEFGLNAPDAPTGQLLTALAAAGRASGTSGAIAVTPAAGVAGLYILRGLAERQTVTCVDPEAEYHNSARHVFRQAGYSASKSRFLPSSPLDVMSRLASGAYHLVYLDVVPIDMRSAIDATLPLLSVGGCAVISDSLLDGTLGDPTRRDRDTQAAREADEYARSLENFHTSRLPLGAGITLITRLQ